MNLLIFTAIILYSYNRFLLHFIFIHVSTILEIKSYMGETNDLNRNCKVLGTLVIIYSFNIGAKYILINKHKLFLQF